jgi:general secretion pathway protein F
MGVYKYIGVSTEGKNVDGIIESDNQKTARQKLKQKGIYATNIIEKSLADVQAKKQTLNVTIGGKVKSSDITMMTRQFATLINANIPIVETLDALSEQVENERLKMILTEAKQKVNEGVSIGDALSPHVAVFSPLYINMIRAGEASGTLGLVLTRLAEYTEKQSILKNKIISSMAYPVLMIFVSIIIIGILFTVVIPKITVVFEDMKTALPIYTTILIWFSNFIRHNFMYIAGFILAAFIIFSRYIKTPTGRKSWDETKLKIPIFGKIIRLSSVSQFTRTLSTLHGAGVPLLQALDIVINVVDNTIIKEALQAAKVDVSEGKSLASTLKKTAQFPPLVIHMITVGEKTGELELMLKHVSEAYDIEVETRIQTLTSLLEPAMIIVMGGTVAFIVISILMPIMQMTNIAS